MTSHEGFCPKHLGDKSDYVDTYTPSLLQPIPRAVGREKIGLTHNAISFSGYDLWTAFELSWLNNKGKPVVGIAEFIVPATSVNLIESKSFKLYLNSLNQSKFDSVNELEAILTKDLTHAAVADVKVKIFAGMKNYSEGIAALEGINIDDLDIEVSDYNFDSDYLQDAVAANTPLISETLTSNLLKSNCLVTHQPDWGTVIIKYQGKQINREQLLRYIISFRQHNEFHEQCVERIFTDIEKYCKPEKLTVFARYTRRGGLDINPFRSNFEVEANVGRLVRQ